MICCALQSAAQSIPTEGEHIDFLMTFGNRAEKTWGDDDHVQTYFFAIPKTQTQAVYIRIFDPTTSGKYDQINNQFNTKTKFSVFGGKGAYSDKDSRNIDPVGNYKAGNLLASHTFGNEVMYDDGWYTFGPFNPQEGELTEELNSYVFKIIAEGIEGDDGNAYRYYLSSDAKTNKPIEGGNGFAYEMSFRLLYNNNEKAHIYPFVDKNVTALKQSNFDFDNDGEIRVTSRTKKSHPMEVSGDGTWISSTEQIDESERNTSLDIQLIKKGQKPNDMVFYLTNQYNQSIPFFSVPLGGIPKYKYKVDMQLKIIEVTK